MILRFSDSISRAFVVFASLVLAVVLSYFAVRMAVAAFASNGDSGHELQAATRWEPRNPEYWFRLGHYEQFNLEQADAARALQSLHEAVALYPQYTDAWLDLATWYELDGDLDEARQDYIRAKASYPKSPEVSWRYGNFLLRTGDLPEAFREIRQSVEAEPSRAAAAFSRVYRADPNLDEILQEVLPPIPHVYVDVIAQATASNQLAFAQLVWIRLLALKPHLQVDDFYPLVAAQAREHDYTMARKVWDQGVSTMNLPPLYRPEDSVVWDPSFESGIEGHIFSWQYKPLEDGVRISLDSSEKHLGNQSVRLSFDGKHNPAMDAVCSLSLVNPATKYRFSVWLKTQELTTEHGVFLRVRSYDAPGNPAVATRDFHNSLPWTLIEMPWTADPLTHVVQICISRSASDDPDVRISGNARVDDINLVPDSAGLPKL
jgi:tetratricopeptide (TPR) repeat protein